MNTRKRGSGSPVQNPDLLPLDERYIDQSVVDQYDQNRYSGPIQGRKARAWQRMVKSSLERVAGSQSVIDIPCGTGFLTEVLHGEFPLTIASDVSPTMLRRAVSRVDTPGVVADIHNLPYKDGSIDCVFNARFMVHFNHEERKKFLKELARVSRRWLLINYNHRYTLKYAGRRVKAALGLMDRARSSAKISKEQLQAEADAADLRIVHVWRELPMVPLFGERWIVLFEKNSA